MSPLPVAQVVDHLPLGRGGIDLEGVVESAIGGLDPKICVENQEWLPNRIDDLLGKLFLMLQQPPAVPPLGDILDGDENQERAIAGTLQPPGTDQHDLCANVF
jgi:hypothetical protein